MKLITYLEGDTPRPGFLSQDGARVYPLAALGVPCETLQQVIEAYSPARLAALCADWQPDGGRPLAETRLLAPLPHPAQDVICLGINYANHASEAARYHADAFGGDRPYPIYFSKRVAEAVPPGGEIQAHSDLVADLDYECELAVVIGETADHVSEADAYRHVFGYTVLNDVSARTLQTRHRQWYFGKGLDGFTPIGPVLLTADACPGKPCLPIRSWVNGELRQNSNTELLIFDVAYVISELSQGIRLLPGTIIAMGTPAGVGMGFSPPKWLKPGDTVTCEIEGIGALTNRVSG